MSADCFIAVSPSPVATARGCSKEKLSFVLIGDRPLQEKCREFIARLGLRGRVFLLGAREDAARLAAGFDVFCLFSLWEGLALTVIEAMLNKEPAAVR